jgi:TPR repeat protein
MAKDEAEAFRWYHQAAEQGFARAQTELARFDWTEFRA